MDRENNLYALHPCFAPKIRLLIEKLDSHHHQGRLACEFRLFETYRSPERQHALFLERPRVTQVDAWGSAHNYGVAADFVGWIDGKPSWDAKLPWADFAFIAHSIPGLSVPIKWDKGHVQSNQWPAIQRAYGLT